MFIIYVYIYIFFKLAYFKTVTCDVTDIEQHNCHTNINIPIFCVYLKCQSLLFSVLLWYKMFY